MELQTAFETRRSIRHYDAEKKVTKEQVETLIKAASLAPSWKNTQTSRYYCVLSEDKVAEFSQKCLPEFNQKNSAGAGALIVTTFVKGLVGFDNDGNPVNEEIQLNEETISAGAPYKNYNPETKNYLSEIRQLIFEGKYPEAQTLAGERLLSKNGFGMPYQTAGSLRLRFQDQEGYTNFRRELDLEKAVASTTYTVDGVDYKREVFTSFADQLVIIRLTASQPGKLTSQLPAKTP